MDILINSPSSALPHQLSFLDLNDDCLFEIMTYLSLRDLIFTSAVCTRFGANAQRLFPHKLQISNNSLENVSTTKSFLPQIGDFLTEVEVIFNYWEGQLISMNEIMELLKTYCENLKIIHLQHWRCEDQQIQLEHLEELIHFSELESLTITFSHTTHIDGSFLMKLSKLKELRLENCSMDLTHLQSCLQNLKATLKTLSLKSCFDEFLEVLIEDIDQIATMSQLELKLNSVPTSFIHSNLFNRLTSLTLANCSTSIDVEKLFSSFIEHNKIQEISFSSVVSQKPLNYRSTVQQLQRLTNLRRLDFAEDDFVTDAFLAEISKGQKLTHFSYISSYRPLLSFGAFLTLNGPKLQKSSYNVYHDIIVGDPKCESKMELMANYRKTKQFQRISKCKEAINSKLTFVEFLFKKL
ncbi:hypothetical protein Bhyg_02008 [Pseudolycoriella hygida]|uniref:F-box domain-containing protein n=1 Tax=Pseudolycoriella hygida TaxID=35572 RepID=A0A9Q0S6A5_9DIPT|nr:hypothetical protein Bhyg_02008 [Pseudolycoriella hygida]